MPLERIHLWGDSVGKGVVYNDARQRYCITPSRFAVSLERALGIPIVNHSRMGATAPEGLAEFERAQADPGTVMVIEYGGNDCDMPWADISEDPEGAYFGKVPLAAFETALQAFVAMVRSRGMTPLLVTPPPLEAGRYFSWVTKGLSREAVLRFLGDVQHIYRWHERYANAIRRVALGSHCALFDLRDALLACGHYPELLCADGIHPNEAGHARITEAVLARVGDLAASLAG